MHLKKASDLHFKEEMPMEIERKFIVHNLPDNLDSYPHSEIEQGYLCMEPVIRIRRMNKQYF